eukprot:6414030-Amphidinium_carterae.2
MDVCDLKDKPNQPRWNKSWLDVGMEPYRPHSACGKELAFGPMVHARVADNLGLFVEFNVLGCF